MLRFDIIASALLPFLDTDEVCEVECSCNDVRALAGSDVWSTLLVEELPGFAFSSEVLGGSKAELKRIVLSLRVVRRTTQLQLSSAPQTTKLCETVRKAEERVFAKLPLEEFGEIFVVRIGFEEDHAEDGDRSKSPEQSLLSEEFALPVLPAWDSCLQTDEQPHLKLRLRWRKGVLSLQGSCSCYDPASNYAVDIESVNEDIILRLRGAVVPGCGKILGFPGLTLARNGNAKAHAALRQGLLCVVCVRWCKSFQTQNRGLGALSLECRRGHNL